MFVQPLSFVFLKKTCGCLRFWKNLLLSFVMLHHELEVVNGLILLLLIDERLRMNILPSRVFFWLHHRSFRNSLWSGKRQVHVGQICLKTCSHSTLILFLRRLIHQSKITFAALSSELLHRPNLVCHGDVSRLSTLIWWFENRIRLPAWFIYLMRVCYCF